MDAASPEVVAYSSQPPGIFAREREEGVGAYACFLGFRFVKVSGSGSVMVDVLPMKGSCSSSGPGVTFGVRRAGRWDDESGACHVYIDACGYDDI
jgi:hypothetical protein